MLILEKSMRMICLICLNMENKDSYIFRQLITIKYKLLNIYYYYFAMKKIE